MKRGLLTLSKIPGIIFDIDGTLVDSNDAHAKAWVEALAEHGINISFEQVRRLIGMGGDKLLPTVAGVWEDSRLGKAMGQRGGEIFKSRYLPHVKASPGPGALLLRMRAD